MRVVSFVYVLLLCFLSVMGANRHTKPLTESMGQEVIEIGGPLKELPPDLEEEPSAENDDDNVTTTTIQAATAKEITKKVLETVEADKKLKDIEKIDRQKDDEEARIEKELADIYKDTLDYKADSAEVTGTKVTAKSESTEPPQKPIARAQNSFKFQPESNNPQDVAFFRTSIDDISCKKDKLSLTTEISEPLSSSGATISNIGLHAIMALLYTYM